MSDVRPARAIVRPRVICPETGDVVLLEDVVNIHLQAKTCSRLIIIGGPRSGKTTALLHLASLPYADQLRIWSCDSPAEREFLFSQDTTVNPLQVCAVTSEFYDSGGESKNQHSLRLQLASWTDDDIIEYLLARHPQRCKSVMTRLSGDQLKSSLGGNPELLTIVLDALAADSGIDVRTALRHGIEQRLGDVKTLDAARDFASAALLGSDELLRSRRRKIDGLLIEKSAMGLLSHRIVCLLLTAERLQIALTSHLRRRFPTGLLPLELIEELATLITGDSIAIKSLHKVARTGMKQAAPMAASLLFRVDPVWRPSTENCKSLADAQLTHADWEQVNLANMNLFGVNLRSSQLAGADFRGSDLRSARLSTCELTGAKLQDSCCRLACFAAANLSDAKMESGEFRCAKFQNANLDRCQARSAVFFGADFTNATCVYADLALCDLQTASMSGANLRGANLEMANLREVSLEHTCLHAAHLKAAHLLKANFEGAQIAGASFEDATLAQALLTGSRMRDVSFRRANLTNTGLADIDWEGVDLRGANFTGAAFHMGSSRCGLVGSPYTSHGTRTGFYTDDYDDHTYKSPEEIRKANLRGADLRGAIVEGADFYLVDLRNATYDFDQVEHFRRCDAILE